MPICQPSGWKMNQIVRISRKKDLYFFNQISRYRRQPWRASVIRAREIHIRIGITNRAFFRRPMGGCERGAAAVALMLRRWGHARAMCPRSPLAAGAGSLRGVCTLRRWKRGKTAVALMQGGGGGGRSWGGVLRSDTVEAVGVAGLILREHPKKHFICWHSGRYMGLVRQSYGGITYPPLSGVPPAFSLLMKPLRGV